jgi:purine-binding chemotaxis protein CheW
MAEKLADLRRDFDRLFASPHPGPSEKRENLLSIQLSGDLYGLRAREIAGVLRAGPLVTLPSRSPGLMGVVGYRGTILPVYGLATLLGYEQTRRAPRWLALCGERGTLALAFEELEGYVPVPAASFYAPDRSSRNYVDRFARIEETVRAIISVPAILGAIKGGP